MCMLSVVSRVGTTGLVLLAVGAIGCTAIQSPPALPVAAEAPKLLEPGQTSIRVEYAMSTEGMNALAHSYTGSARHGLTERVEFTASATGTYIDTGERRKEADPEWGEFLHRGVYAARAGIKLKVIDHIALSAGFGGGVAPAAGGFVSPEAAVILGYENPYFVPITTFRAFYSAPINAKSIPNTWEYSQENDVLKAHATVGTSLFFGAKIPIGRRNAGPERTSGNIYFGAGPTWTFDVSNQPDAQREYRPVFVQAAVSGELVLGRRKAVQTATATPSYHDGLGTNLPTDAVD